MKNVVIIEKDEILNDILSYHISNYFEQNCHVSFIRKKEIIEIFNHKPVDLLIINYLEIFDNLKVLNEIKKNKTNNIIIIYNNLENRHKNKNLSNFKFVVKPFKLKILFSIISDFFMDFDLEEKAINLTSNLIFKPNKKIIMNEKTKTFVYLTEKETKLFKYLFENINITISKKQLLQYVWDFNENIETHTLETHIYRLKKKIEKLENKVNFYFFSQGGGYAIICK